MDDISYCSVNRNVVAGRSTENLMSNVPR